MPPHIHSSDEDSGDDVIMPNKTAKMSDEFDGDEASDKGESDNEESNAEGVYTVEAILDHKFDGSVSNSVHNADTSCRVEGRARDALQVS